MVLWVNWAVSQLVSLGLNHVVRQLECHWVGRSKKSSPTGLTGGSGVGWGTSVSPRALIL